MNYIGADVHISSIDFAVVNETGQVVKRERIGTSERGIAEFVKSIRAPRQLIIEEGSLAGWIKDVMENRGERVVVTDPKRNKWIGFSESKDDRIDAEKLAKLHRGGYTKEIVQQKSGKSASPVHLTADYNRRLKWAFKTAARCAIASGENPFRRQYLRLTMEQGIMEHRASLTVARSIASTVYAVWKKGSEYDPSIRDKIAA